MVTESIRVSRVFPISPARLYDAWLDSGEHARFTGGEASIEPTIGGAHSSWDGYIWGRILELEPGRRIVQTWRTSEFPEGSEDSRLEILFEPDGKGTRMTLVHTEIPEGQRSRYESGWEDFYFEPMMKYFAAAVAPLAAALGAAKKAIGAGAKKAAAAMKSGMQRAATNGTRRAKAKPKKAKAKTKVKAKARGKTRAKAKTKVRAKAKAKSRKKARTRRAKSATKRGARRTMRAKARRGGRKTARRAGRKAARRR